MADFNKYSREAKKDPKFREELLHGDAHQAIKARFGDDLPYKVECEEEITFKIKTSDSEFERVAGGVPRGGLLGRSVIQFDPDPNGQAFFPGDSGVGTCTTYENGNPVQNSVMKTDGGMVKFVKKPRLGAIPDDDLDAVAGGTNLIPYDPKTDPERHFCRLYGTEVDSEGRECLVGYAPRSKYDIVQYKQEDGSWGPRYKRLKSFESPESNQG